jgi:hypothetical protein
MNLLEQETEILTMLRDHAEDRLAPRSIWELSRCTTAMYANLWHGTGSPFLHVGIGYGVGVLHWNGLVAVGGSNPQPVVYEWGPTTDAFFPVGSELPIGQVLNAIEEYARTGGMPTSVRWSRGFPGLIEVSEYSPRLLCE